VLLLLLLFNIAKNSTASCWSITNRLNRLETCYCVYVVWNKFWFKYLNLIPTVKLYSNKDVFAISLIYMEIMRWALKTCFTSTSITIYFAFKIFYRISALLDRYSRGTAKRFVTQYSICKLTKSYNINLKMNWNRSCLEAKN